MSLDRNTKALVTGASSGIGEATVRALRAFQGAGLIMIYNNQVS